ncbi:glycosyltransferase family 4 protein [Muricoccus radiodurans]|uniref:glycosyltransferase family 4 protein n=1 Tax=Muricoccus radiodurans TaxID=2231721 RepID=UPI003CEABCF3
MSGAPQRIGLVSSAVPLIDGGARFIVRWLAERLTAAGHRVEEVLLPSSDDPATLLHQMAAWRMIDLDAHFDRIVTFRPPSHLVRHRRKMCWFIHHIRIFYDLWGPEHGHLPDTPEMRGIRAAMHRADTRALAEAHGLFSNSRVVAERVRRFNGLSPQVLYPPVQRPELFVPGPFGDAIVSVCRMEAHKRQHLLIEAMAHTRTPVRLHLAGLTSDPAYHDRLRALVAQHGLEAWVTLDHRWITEEEKAALLSGALANAYLPVDEDSYGYPTLEAAHARRATVTTPDSGGVMEFVRDGVEGIIAPAKPAALAAAFDALYEDRARAARLGAAAEARVAELGVTWDAVIARLLA